MNKTTILAACIVLLFGGLLGLHLAAQPGGTGSRATENASNFSLLDPNVSERSERELLERKVIVHRRIVMRVESHVQAGQGNAMRLAEARADLAAAEIELYRYTGEQDKLLVALKARVEHLTEKLRAATNAFDANVSSLDEFHAVELQLLDALLEQKRAVLR
jgi:outer membrane protein TolC